MLTRRAAMAAATVVAADGARAQLPIRWTIATEYPATAIPGEGIATFAALAGEATAGVVTVQPRFDAPDGLRSAAMPDAVSSGRIEAGDSFAATLAPLSPIFQLSGLPFLTRSAADAQRLFALARPAYEAALAGRGLVLLFATFWPPSGLWSREPVPDAAALVGLRVRTYDAASTAVFAAAGARPSQLSFADALPRLRAGELDAVLSSGDGGAGLRLWEALPHFTVLDYAFPLSLGFCADRALAALPPPVADALRRAGAETQARQYGAMSTRVAANEARMRANGVTLATAPAMRDALAAHAAPVIDDWLVASGPAGRNLLERFRA